MGRVGVTRTGRFGLIAVLVLSLAPSGCTLLEPATAPLLPPGIEQCRVPNVPLDAVLYVSQDSAFAVPWVEAHPPVEQLVVGLSPVASTEAVWAHGSFQSPSGASTASGLGAGLQDSWKLLHGRDLFVAHSQGIPATSLIRATEQGDFVVLKEAFSDEWDLMSHLPEDPPGRPVAAGFLSHTANLENWARALLDDEQAIAIFVDVMRQAKIESVGIGIYSEDDLNLVGEREFEDSSVSILLVGKSSYPGFVLSTVLQVPSLTGLTEHSIGDTEVYGTTIDDIHLVLKNSGSYLYVSISPNSAEAKGLLASALGVGGAAASAPTSVAQTTPTSPEPTSPGPTTPVPQVVEVYGTSTAGLRVRTSPSLDDGNIIGKVFDGTRLSVVAPPRQADGYEWLGVRLEGWLAANWLSGSPTPGATVTVKETGDLGLRVREEPIIGDNVLGKLYDGTRLLVVDGPASGSGYQWWKVKLEGWSADQYLREPTASVLTWQETGKGEEAAISPQELQRKVDALKKILENDLRTTFLPSEGFTLQRWLAANVIERSDEFYFLSLDYNLLATRTLRFAESWMEASENQLASEYIRRAYRYVKISDNFEGAAIDQLQAGIDISWWLVIEMAAETALGFAGGTLAAGLSVFAPTARLPASLAINVFRTYVDYSIDTAVRGIPTDKAARRALTGLVVRQVVQTPLVRKAIGEPVTKYIGGESGLYQKLEETMLSQEVRQEIMRVIALGAEDVLVETAAFDAEWLANEVIDRLEEAAR